MPERSTPGAYFAWPWGWAAAGRVARASAQAAARRGVFMRRNLAAALVESTPNDVNDFSCPALGSVGVHLQGGDEGFLGDLHLAELAHALLALLLLVEEFALSRHVA